MKFKYCATSLRMSRVQQDEGSENLQKLYVELKRLICIDYAWEADWMMRVSAFQINLTKMYPIICLLWLF